MMNKITEQENNKLWAYFFTGGIPLEVTEDEVKGIISKLDKRDQKSFLAMLEEMA